MKFLSQLFILTCFCIVSFSAFSQGPSTPTISIALLEPAPGHDCAGKVRISVQNCACGTSADGVWSVSFGPAPGNTAPASIGSRAYATCDVMMNDDLDILPGDYIFTAGIRPDPRGCHNLDQVLTFNISVPDGPCSAPNLYITGVLPETGNGCNNGVISVLGEITMCSAIGMGFQLFDSADNLIAEREGNIYGAGLDKQFGGLRAGNYTVKAFQGGGRTPCTQNILIERDVVVGRNPVNRSGGARLETETGDGGCQRHKIICNYSDDYNSKTCTGPGPQVWQAHLTGETINGQEIDMRVDGLFGENIIIENMPPGNYEVECSRSVPGPFEGEAGSSITVPGNACSATLAEVNRTTNNGKGIGCDSAAVIEFSFSSNACYQEWTLYQPDILGLGSTGTWTALRGENIRVALPGSFDGTGYSYQFFATHDGDPLLDCVARTNVSGVPSLGCDATVTATKTKEVSVPGASDAEYTFTLNTSSCLEAPWWVVMKHSTTGEEYSGSAESKKDTIIIDSLPQGNYTWAFEFAGAGGCGSPNAGGGGLDCNNPVTVYQDNDGDGFGNPAVSSMACFANSLAGYVGNNTDTNDNLKTYPDNDGDGFGAGSPVPSGVPNNDDPNDSNSNVYPGAPEICDGIDNDGNGIVDSAFMNGLILYMPMNGDAADRGPNSINGIINGTVTPGTDRFGNPSGAMVFNGNQNNHIRIDDNSLLRPSSITLSAWVYIAAQRSPSTFISKSVGCYNHSWHFGTEGSSYSSWVAQNAPYCGDFVRLTAPYTERVWKHVVYTIDDIADTRKLYVDGVEVASGGYTFAIPYEATPLLIGASMWGGTALDFPFIGNLDDVMIFNRAISAAEVSKLFTNGSPLTALNARYYADADGDGFGNPAVSQAACSQPPGYTLNKTDCDDTHSTVYPGAPEICDGLDNDCDGHVDSLHVNSFVCGTASSEGASFTLTAPPGEVFIAVDFASYGTPTGNCGNFTLGSCHAASTRSVIEGMVIGRNSVTITQDYRLFGDPCVGIFKRLYVQARYKAIVSLSNTFYRDADSDGFGNPALSQVACNQPAGYVLNSIDCDDTHNTVYPDAPEICDGLDNNCDGIIETAFPTNGLVAHYPFAGNANNVVSTLSGTVNGATLITDRFGKPNSAYSFNGINQSITAPVATTVTNDFALTGWVRLNAYAAGNQLLFCNGNSSGNGWGLIVNSTGNLHVIYGGIVFSNTLAQISLNRWKHFALARVAGTTIVYVDGIQVFSSSLPSPLAPSNNLTIGMNNLGNEYLNGSIDDIKVYNTALTATQVKQDYNAGAQLIYYRDADGDSFGDPAATTNANCGAGIPAGYVSNSNDCDDTNANVNPLVSPGVILGVTTMCAGSASTFTATGTPGGTWISRNPEIATVDANGLVTAIGNGITKIVYQVNDCTPEGRMDSVFLNVAAQYVWTGAGANADWNNVSNWTSCGVPPPGANVTINDAVNKPSLNIDVTVGNLLLSGNASMLLKDKTLMINGSVTGTGTLSTSPASSLVAAGNAGIVVFSPGKDTIKQITLLQNAALSIGSRLYVKAGTQPGEITLQQGSVLNANGNLTLLSDINGTARLAEIPVDASGNAMATINGDVVVERFIPKNTYKAWQLLSVPTKGLQTIKQSWQENQPAGVTGITGYGTRITSAPGFGANGFDGTSTKASIQSYNPANGQLVYLTSTLNPAATSSGYFLFVRGDRTVGISGNNLAVNATKLRTKGQLYYGDQPPISSVEANRHFMVGNIYPSSIDFARLPRTGGVGSTFYLWDPKLNNGVTLGGYQTFSATNGYAPVIPGGSYTSPNSVIQSGQAFYAFAGSSPGTIQMIEAAKTAGTANSVFRPAKRSATIDAKLIAIVHDSAFTADAHHLAFDGQFANEVDEMDAIKMINPGAGISSQVSEQLLAIDTRTSILLQDSIQYHLSNLHQGQYQLHFQFASVAEQGTAVYLEDSYLNRVIPLDCTASAGYSFTVDNDAASGASNRFVLLFTQKKNIPFADAADQKLQVNPNPAAGGYFNLVLTGFPKGRYHLKLLSTRGEVVLVRSGEATAGNSTIRVALEQALAAGVYVIEFIDVNNRRFSESLIIK